MFEKGRALENLFPYADRSLVIPEVWSLGKYPCGLLASNILAVMQTVNVALPIWGILTAYANLVE